MEQKNLTAATGFLVILLDPVACGGLVVSENNPPPSGSHVDGMDSGVRSPIDGARDERVDSTSSRPG